MNISEGRIGFEPTVLNGTTDPHDGHIINQWQGFRMVGITGDISNFSNKWDGDKDITEWHVRYKLVHVMIYWCMVNRVVKSSDNIRAIICIMVIVTINQRVPILCTYSIHKDMPISPNIIQKHWKISFYKQAWGHVWWLNLNNGFEKEKCKPPPEIVGGNPNQLCRRHPGQILEELLWICY